MRPCLFNLKPAVSVCLRHSKFQYRIVYSLKTAICYSCITIDLVLFPGIIKPQVEFLRVYK